MARPFLIVLKPIRLKFGSALTRLGGKVTPKHIQ